MIYNSNIRTATYAQINTNAVTTTNNLVEGGGQPDSTDLAVVGLFIVFLLIILYFLIRHKE